MVPLLRMRSIVTVSAVCVAPGPGTNGASVATGPVILGDKGDGSPMARDAAKRRNAHFNADHCPDIIEPDDVDRLYETRCYTPFRATAAMGHGSRGGGGKPSTHEGHWLAFGCTREDIRRTAIGCAARGAPGEPPLNHSTGTGRVEAHAGQYADALDRGKEVWVLTAEVTGALDESFDRLMSLCHARSRITGHRDGTRYGSSRAATRSFYTHHKRMLSLAVAVSVAESVANYNNAIKSQLAGGPSGAYVNTPSGSDSDAAAP